MMTPEQLKTLKLIVEDKQATIKRLDVTNEVDYKAAERLEREIKDITAAIETVDKPPKPPRRKGEAMTPEQIIEFLEEYMSHEGDEVSEFSQVMHEAIAYIKTEENERRTNAAKEGGGDG
ncbi:MAG: hypothetical protein AAFX41_14785 [Bacteroidota bacterium]